MIENAATTEGVTMPTTAADWAVPPVEYTYDGRPLAEFEDPMLLSVERVRIRFGGTIPRDVSLALNDAYRRGLRDGRATLKEKLRRAFCA